MGDAQQASKYQKTSTRRQAPRGVPDQQARAQERQKKIKTETKTKTKPQQMDVVSQ